MLHSVAYRSVRLINIQKANHGICINAKTRYTDTHHLKCEKNVHSVEAKIKEYQHLEWLNCYMKAFGVQDTLPLLRSQGLLFLLSDSVA